MISRTQTKQHAIQMLKLQCKGDRLVSSQYNNLKYCSSLSPLLEVKRKFETFPRVCEKHIYIARECTKVTMLVHQNFPTATIFLNSSKFCQLTIVLRSKKTFYSLMLMFKSFLMDFLPSTRIPNLTYRTKVKTFPHYAKFILHS